MSKPGASSKDGSKFPCPVEDCASGFTRRDGLRVHVAAKHGKGLGRDRRGNDMLVDGDPELLERARKKYGYTPSSTRDGADTPSQIPVVTSGRKPKRTESLSVSPTLTQRAKRIKAPPSDVIPKPVKTKQGKDPSAKAPARKAIKGNIYLVRASPADNETESRVPEDDVVDLTSPCHRQDIDLSARVTYRIGAIRTKPKTTEPSTASKPSYAPTLDVCGGFPGHGGSSTSAHGAGLASSSGPTSAVVSSGKSIPSKVSWPDYTGIPTTDKKVAGRLWGPPWKPPATGSQSERVQQHKALVSALSAPPAVVEAVQYSFAPQGIAAAVLKQMIQTIVPETPPHSSSASTEDAATAAAPSVVIRSQRSGRMPRPSSAPPLNSSPSGVLRGATPPRSVGKSSADKQSARQELPPSLRMAGPSTLRTSNKSERSEARLRAEQRALWEALGILPADSQDHPPSPRMAGPSSSHTSCASCDGERHAMRIRAEQEDALATFAALYPGVSGLAQAGSSGQGVGKRRREKGDDEEDNARQGDSSAEEDGGGDDDVQLLFKQEPEDEPEEEEVTYEDRQRAKLAEEKKKSGTYAGRRMTKEDDRRLVPMIKNLPRSWHPEECVRLLQPSFPDVDPAELRLRLSFGLQMWLEYRVLNDHDVHKDIPGVHAGVLTKYTQNCLYAWSGRGGQDE
jgi:hypothetical protein